MKTQSHFGLSLVLSCEAVIYASLITYFATLTLCSSKIDPSSKVTAMGLHGFFGFLMVFLLLLGSANLLMNLDSGFRYFGISRLLAIIPLRWIVPSLDRSLGSLFSSSLIVLSVISISKVWLSVMIIQERKSAV